MSSGRLSSPRSACLAQLRAGEEVHVRASVTIGECGDAHLDVRPRRERDVQFAALAGDVISDDARLAEQRDLYVVPAGRDGRDPTDGAAGRHLRVVAGDGRVALDEDDAGRADVPGGSGVAAESEAIAGRRRRPARRRRPGRSRRGTRRQAGRRGPVDRTVGASRAPSIGRRRRIAFRRRPGSESRGEDICHARSGQKPPQLAAGRRPR